MKSRTREGLELVCPFCRTSLPRPSEMRISSTEVGRGGTCGTCGALYVLDATGKNVGEVMMQGLVLAADRLQKDTSEMASGEDYEDIVLSYDSRTHRSSGEAKNYMDGHGRLYVIRLKKNQER